MENKKKTKAIPLAALALVAGAAILLPSCAGSNPHSSVSLVTSDTDGDKTSEPEPDTSSVDDLPTDPLLRKYTIALRNGEDLSEALTIQEIMGVVEKLWAQNENNSWYCNGAAVAMSFVTQKIQSAGIKSGDEYFSESLSQSAFVSTGARTYQSTGVDVIKASAVQAGADGVLSGTWDGEETHYETPEAYAEAWGWDLSHFGNYYFGDFFVDGITKNSIITEPTSEDDTEPLSSAVRNEDGSYTVYIRLDPVGGVSNYQKQMVTLSGLAEVPPFDFCNLTYQLNSELEPISATIHEKYTATMASLPIPASTEANLTVNYFPGVSAEIPENGEAVDYSVSGLTFSA